MGDENRQHLILEMIKMGECSGVRVGAVTEKTNLSRPAVSHHLQILKEAGLLKVRREGTKNYYYFDADAEAMSCLIHMLEHAKRFIEMMHIQLVINEPKVFDGFMAHYGKFSGVKNYIALIGKKIPSPRPFRTVKSF